MSAVERRKMFAKLADVIQAIEAAKIKRDFIHELTPANKEF